MDVKRGKGKGERGKGKGERGKGKGERGKGKGERGKGKGERGKGAKGAKGEDVRCLMGDFYLRTQGKGGLWWSFIKYSL